MLKSGYRIFAKNVGILSIANFSTKFLSFLLVPLYTNILSTSDYGTYDLVFNAISVMIPIFTLNVVDAVLRFSIDHNANKNGIISIGIKYFLISFVVISAALIVNAIFNFFSVITDLSICILLMFASQALTQIFLYYARGINRFVDVAVSSVLCSIITITANIVFLVVFQWGLTGYFFANILGPVIQIIYLAIRIDLSQVDLRHIDKALERSMIAYSRPLIANSIAWWVNNVSDRFIVTFFCGVAVNGVYSIASKIPSILNIFQTILGQAWTISAVDEFDSEDTSGFFSNMYALYNCLMVIACSIIIALDIPLARLLYAMDFFEAWRYVPFLAISVVFGALAGYVGGILAAVKNSKEFARTSVAGAITNIALNLVMVPFIGPLGSAIATAVCYWLTWHLRMRVMKKYIRFRIAYVRNGLSYSLLIVQSILLLIMPDQQAAMYAAETVCVVIQIFMYRSEIKQVLGLFFGRLKG